MNSFIAWKGGKHLLAKTIVKKMPPHTCYVEVFGGAGWVLFRKPQEMSKVEVYNDLNSDLVNLFRVIRDKHEQFFYRQYFLLASREEYQNYQQRYKDTDFANINYCVVGMARMNGNDERVVCLVDTALTAGSARIHTNNTAWGSEDVETICIIAIGDQ